MISLRECIRSEKLSDYHSNFVLSNIFVSILSFLARQKSANHNANLVDAK